jgi:hypothetical protein
MIDENDIRSEVTKLNESAGKYGRNYEYKKGENGLWGLFDVHGNVYKPIYASSTPAGFYAYISLLKNLFQQGKFK